MLKKFLIVCVCVLAVIAVFGITDRLDYYNIHLAVESVQAEASEILTDVTLLEFAGSVLSDYVRGASIRVHIAQMGPPDPLNPEDDPWYVWYEMEVNQDVVDSVPEGWVVPDDWGDYTLERTFVFASEDEAKRVYSIIEEFESGSDGFNDLGLELLNDIDFGINVVISYGKILLTVLFDGLDVGLEIIHMVLYLFGLAPTI